MPLFHAIRVSVLAQPKNGKFTLPFQASSDSIKLKKKRKKEKRKKVYCGTVPIGVLQKHFQDHVYCSTLAISTTCPSNN
jgi:hypothetical protein